MELKLFYQIMKKNLLDLVTILMLALVSFGFTSCSSNDDDNNNKDELLSSSIIGTWRESWGEGPSKYTAYSFFDDGTGLHFDKGNGAQHFTYSFNFQTKNVSIEYSEYDKEQMIVSKITSNSLVMNGDEYKKVVLTYDMLILGEWYLYVGGINTDGVIGKKTRVVFRADNYVEGTGTYEAKDYYNYDDTDEWKHSFYGLSGRVNGTWSIKGERLSIKGSSQIAGEYIIADLVVDGCRLVRASNPEEFPYLIGGWYQR